jgi:hypothetical protein
MKDEDTIRTMREYFQLAEALAKAGEALSSATRPVGSWSSCPTSPAAGGPSQMSRHTQQTVPGHRSRCLPRRAGVDLRPAVTVMTVPVVKGPGRRRRT